MNSLCTPLVIVAALSLSASACSSGGDGASNTNPAATEVVTTAVETTAETTDPPVPTPTTPSTTTEPATTAAGPPETTQTTTADDIKDAMAAGIIESSEAFVYAVYNVDAPDALDRFRASTTGPSLELGLANFQTLVDNGWRGRPNPDIADETRIESVEIVSSTEAQVVTCEINAGVVFAPGAAPDGTDVVVNNEVVAARDLLTAVLEDDVWKLQSGERLKEWEGESECSPA